MLRRPLEDHEYQYEWNETALKDLWMGAVKPVLDALGYRRKMPIDQLPHITWCTTGLLSFIPLHASGPNDPSRPSTFDLVISSYTPTLTALLQSQSMVDCQSGILAIGQEHTPNLSRLPFVNEELQVVRKHAQADYHRELKNDQATVRPVLEAMDQFSWVHLACHGSQDANNATQSAFHLYDGKLMLAELTRRSFQNKGLAFLSACHTAAGDKRLSEEAVHLASGMLMAGYPSVIGTMWSIKDKDGPLVADKVYEELIKDGRMDHTKAAKALHQAVAHLREQKDVGARAIARWAPFIHVGC